MTEVLNVSLVEAVLETVGRPALGRDGWYVLDAHWLPSPWAGFLLATLVPNGRVLPTGEVAVSGFHFRHLIDEIRSNALNLRHLQETLAKARKGPSRHCLLHAPLLDPWAVVNMPGSGPCLVGMVSGHDGVPGGWTEAPDLFSLGPSFRWALTSHQWYLLGEPFGPEDLTVVSGGRLLPAAGRLTEQELRLALESKEADCRSRLASFEALCR